MLLGRDLERRALDDLLTAARVGTSGVLVLTGEPGVGKSALLDEACALAPSMRVLRARGIESEQSVPFAGLLQLLRPLLPLLHEVPGPQSDALTSALMLGAERAREPGRFAVGSATLTLLSRAADEQPLVVLVDDGHLVDRPSVDALVFAARRLESDHVAVLVSVRDGEPGGDPWTVLPTRTLAGLDLASARVLLNPPGAAPLTGPQIVQLHGATAGNPLAMLELREQADRLDGWPLSPVHVPAAVSRAFVGRFDVLDAASRLALVVAAADGTSLATVHQACGELGLGPSPLEAAETSGLVTVQGDRVEFRHPLVRSVVYGRADDATRRLVHRTLASVLPPEQTDRRAWHLAESTEPPDEEVAQVLDEVAVHASVRGAHSTATVASERAAHLGADPDQVSSRLAAAGRSAWLAGLTDRAVSLLDRAVDKTTDRAQRLHILEVRGAIEFRSGSLEDARDMLIRAAEESGDVDPAHTVRVLSDAIHICFYLGDTRVAMSLNARIEALLPSTTDPHSRFLGLMASGMAMILDGTRGDLGPHRIRDALDEVADRDEPESDVFRLPHRILGLLYLREDDETDRVIDETVRRLRDEAALGTLPYVLMHVARGQATSDRWKDAESAYLEGIRLAEETGQTTDLAMSAAGLACLYARQGRGAEVRSLIDRAAGLCARGQLFLGESWLDFARGDLAAAEADPRSAAGHFERLHARLTGAGLSDPDACPVPELVEIYLQLGTPERAGALVEDFAATATAKGQPWSLARLARARGLCADDEEAAVEHFTTALALHARTLDGYETARTQLALGARLRRARRRVDARPALTDAVAAFERLGARPWADRAAAELAATGLSVRRRTATPTDALTPQQRQIAQLLADGRTTREAAAALFLSPKTVEYHLRHVYLQLGVNSRDALAEALRP